MSKKICIVTGTRAEYGLLRWLMQDLSETSEFQLQIIATGMHLSPEFGMTYREIEQDGFSIDRKVEILLSSDTATGVSKAMGLGMIGFADAFEQLKPDGVMVLGDRFEALSAATAALIARIPIVHIHGGELTEGAVDDSIRHALTKIACLHFVAADTYRQRVIQLGEPPENVHDVGGLGLDAIDRTTLLSRAELEESLAFEFQAKNLLVTFHPATMEKGTAQQDVKALLGSLAKLKGVGLLITLPNADPESRELISLFTAFAEETAHAKCFTSLGQQRYFSALNQVDGVVGNSSSGLLEVPSFKKGTINIGSRQGGRLRATSVIDCAPTVEAIDLALTLLFSAEFQSGLLDVQSPYGAPGASRKIVDVLKNVNLKDVSNKRFFDLPVEVLSFNREKGA